VKKCARVMLLLGAAGAAGLAVCLIVVLVAWNDMSLWVLSPEQYATRHGLLVLGRAIYVYGVDNKTLPASLEDLRGTEYGRDLVFGEKGGPLDGWGRPFVYARDDGNCSVTSFGRDGLPGGVGMDSDMTDASPFPTYIRPTLMEFVKYCPEGMLGAAVLSGGPPQWHEIVVPLILWSVVFELWLPHTTAFRGLATSDYRDVVFYSLGAAIAAAWWGRARVAGGR